MPHYVASPDLHVAIQDLRTGLRILMDRMVQAEAAAHQLDQRLAAVLDTTAVAPLHPAQGGR